MKWRRLVRLPVVLMSAAFGCFLGLGCSGDDVTGKSDTGSAVSSGEVQAFVGTWTIAESLATGDCGDAFLAPSVGSTITLTQDGDVLTETWTLPECRPRMTVSGSAATLESTPLTCTETSGAGVQFNLTVTAYDYELVSGSLLKKSYDVSVNIVRGNQAAVSCAAHVDLTFNR